MYGQPNDNLTIIPTYQMALIAKKLKYKDNYQSGGLPGSCHELQELLELSELPGAYPLEHLKY